MKTERNKNCYQQRIVEKIQALGRLKKSLRPHDILSNQFHSFLTGFSNHHKMSPKHCSYSTSSKQLTYGLSVRVKQHNKSVTPRSPKRHNCFIQVPTSISRRNPLRTPLLARTSPSRPITKSAYHRAFHRTARCIVRQGKASGGDNHAVDQYCSCHYQLLCRYLQFDKTQCEGKGEERKEKEKQRRKISNKEDANAMEIETD